MYYKSFLLHGKVLLLFLAAVVIFCGCSVQTDDTETTVAEAEVNTTVQTQLQNSETKTEFEWQKDNPEDHNIDKSELDSIHSLFDDVNILSVVTAKDGYIIDEYYADGYDETSEFMLNSASKSFTSALVGIAIDLGYIEGTDVFISEYFPQIESLGNDYMKQITIEHLLTHTSGINYTDDSSWYDWRDSDNWIDYILNCSADVQPGTEFRYSTGNTHLLCAIIQKTTGMTAYEFGKQYLFDPLSMDSVSCGSDAQGISDGGNGFSMSIYDMLKLGQLYLNGGVWLGEQIVSSSWVDTSTSVQFERSTGTADYGYQWWVRTFGNDDYNAFFAQGHGGQYIFVIPDLELVIAVTSDYEGSTSIYWQIANSIVNAASD